MMTMCAKACTDSNGVRSSYHCNYSNAGLEGQHEEHDWYSCVHKAWMHCHGSKEKDDA